MKRKLIWILVLSSISCTREWSADMEFEVLEAKKKNCGLFRKEWAGIPIEAYRENMKFVRANCEKFGWWEAE